MQQPCYQLRLIEKLKHMKKISSLLVLAFLSFALIAQAANPIRISTSTLSQQEPQVRNFNGIEIGGNIRAYVKLGNSESLRLEGDKEAIAQLEIEVKNGTLTIKPKRSQWKDWFKKYNNTKITAYITAKRLTSLGVSGSGLIDVEQTINADKVGVAVSGSGSIKATVTASHLDGAISGSGSLNISGKAKSAEVAISGSGNFNGKDLVTDDAETHISGSGSIYIHANKSIDAALSGSGNVNYSGDPKVEKAVAGSGKVRKI